MDSMMGPPADFCRLKWLFKIRRQLMRGFLAVSRYAMISAKSAPEIDGMAGSQRLAMLLAKKGER